MELQFTSLTTSSILIDGFWLQHVPGGKGGNSFSLAFFFFFSFALALSPFLSSSFSLSRPLFLSLARLFAHSFKCMKTQSFSSSLFLFLSFFIFYLSFRLSVSLLLFSLNILEHFAAASFLLYFVSEPFSTLHKHCVPPRR